MSLQEGFITACIAIIICVFVSLLILEQTNLEEMGDVIAKMEGYCTENSMVSEVEMELTSSNLKYNIKCSLNK